MSLLTELFAQVFIRVIREIREIREIRSRIRLAAASPRCDLCVLLRLNQRLDLG
jgi:hypothetical protein